MAKAGPHGADGNGGMDTRCPATRQGRLIFLLSPASCGGRRAHILLRDGAKNDLALRLRTVRGVPLGETFTFLSGLYFRGKLVYARAFARPPAGTPGALVITTSRGLVAADTHVTIDDLHEFAGVDIATDNPVYREPLEQTVEELAAALRPRDRVVLLGSIATGKYADVLSAILGARLRFPEAFVGRGDMSRGGLMLRCAEDGEELEYVPLAGAVRHGPRPPKLAPKSRAAQRA